jgi:adenylate kinase
MPPVTELQNARIVFVLGGPGSGKGTQCAKIVDQYGFTHLSTGDLLRDEVASGSERGKKLNEIMQRGDLVPLDDVLGLLRDAMISKAGVSKGFLIDGYPRELQQGLKFEADVGPVESVISFEVADETMQERLMLRKRADDNEVTIANRIKTFHTHTRPVIEHYDKQHKVFKIDAERTVDEIFADVQSHLNKK